MGSEWARSRAVDPPKLVDVLPEHPGGRAEVGWLYAWLRQLDGSWQGFVRMHNAATGGTWIPADRLRERGPLTAEEIRALGGIPADPTTGEPLRDM